MLNVHRAAETFSHGFSLTLRDHHGAISSGDAVKRQPGLAVLEVLCDVITQQLVIGVVVRRHAVGYGPVPLLLPDGHSQSRQANANVLKGMQKENAHDNCNEATQGANDVVDAHVLPFFEQYGRAGEHRGGEEHVVNGRHQRRVKDVQRFVQVVDLRANTSYQAQKQQPGQWVPQHWLPCDGLFNRDAQSFDAGDRQGPNHRADGDVDQDVGLAVARAHYEDEYEGYDDDSCRKHHKAWRQLGEKVINVISYVKQSFLT